MREEGERGGGREADLGGGGGRECVRCQVPWPRQYCVISLSLSALCPVLLLSPHLEDLSIYNTRVLSLAASKEEEEETRS